MIAQGWAMLTTTATYVVSHPVILFGGFALAASVITSLIVSEVKNR